MFYNGILKHAQLSSFTWRKRGPVLITYAIGTPYVMAHLYYYTVINFSTDTVTVYDALPRFNANARFPPDNYVFIIWSPKNVSK